MPTNLPAHPRSNAVNYDLASNGKAFLKFYGFVALAVALLLAIEAETGMFAGLTAAEAVLKATAIEMPTNEIGIVWAGLMF